MLQHMSISFHKEPSVILVKSFFLKGQTHPFIHDAVFLLLCKIKLRQKHLFLF